MSDSLDTPEAHARLYAACRSAEVAVEHALRVEGPRFGSAGTAPALLAVIHLCRAACAESTGEAPGIPPGLASRLARLVGEAADLRADRDRLTAGLRVLEQEALTAYGRLAALHPGELAPRLVAGLLDGLRTLLAPGKATEAQEAPP